MIRRLSILAIVLTIVLMPLIAVYTLTTNATVTNEMAVDQLNGGDEEYIEAQMYNNYKNVLASVITVIATTISIIILLIASYMAKTILNKRTQK